jgi:Uma2 family endonuclease
MASAATRQRLMTLEECLALPEEKPALELVDGNVYQKPMAKYDHSVAQVAMVIALHEHPATAGGRTMTELGLNAPEAALPNHRVPDLAYFRAGRAPSKPHPSEPPDLAVEIRSEGQTLA